MIRRLVLPFSVLLVACGTPEQPDSAGGPALEQPLADQRSVIAGYEAYQATCARCHDTGVDGAPVTRNQADWGGRSQLWQAVLMDHANSGYIDMPAKGGNTALSDRTVDAAVEYMLTITFPNRPPD
jgi:cytochrome c5